MSLGPTGGHAIPYTGALHLEIGTLPALVLRGSGSGESEGAGNAASLSGGPGVVGTTTITDLDVLFRLFGELVRDIIQIVRIQNGFARVANFLKELMKRKREAKSNTIKDNTVQKKKDVG